MTEHINTVVIGAGQAGLATSYHLAQNDHDHIILEQAEDLASAWHKRWDSFTLVTPNHMLRLPDFPYQGDDPAGFLPRHEVITYLKDFAATFDPPVRFGVRVSSVEAKPDGTGYIVHTGEGRWEADNVIVAVGTFQKPHIPAFSQTISQDITQIHSSDYRNPGTLPEGPVLVVGAGQSGCQIAEELYQRGRKVYLSTCKARRFPRRYRGQDFMEWADALGIFDQTVDELDSPAERFVPNPRISGKDGGHSLNLHRFARDGVTLLGHMEAAQGDIVRFDSRLHEYLAHGDKTAAEFKKGVDKLIEKAGMDAPTPRDVPERQDGFESEIIRELDLKTERIGTIIWATGYSFDFGWVNLPVLDEYGYPIQDRGITGYPGLYFVGLHWLHTIESGLLAGVGKDAAHIVEHLVQRSERIPDSG